MLSFRRANEGDMMLYFEWANDDEVRKQSYKSGVIDLEDHKIWFLKKITDNDSLMLLFEDEQKRPVGQVRFQKEDGNTSVIGVSVAKEFRRKGLAADILQMASDHFLSLFPGQMINAYIKISNIGSARAFAKAGFVFAEQLVMRDIDTFLYIKSRNNAVS